MLISGDPEKDFKNWDRERSRRLARRPRCAECHEYIQDDECYEIDGKLICPECLEANYARNTDDYID
jgi:formylmethanofuran dehydrogenase subunit E